MKILILINILYISCFLAATANNAEDWAKTEVLSVGAYISGSTSLCRGDTIILTAEPWDTTFTYRWSTGEKTQKIAVTRGGTYFVEIATKNNEKDTAYIFITENPRFRVIIKPGGPTSFCEGDSIRLQAYIEGSDYIWQNYYKENFDSRKSFPEWSTTVSSSSWQNPIKTDSSSIPKKRFLGVFGNQKVTLKLNNLPVHDFIEVLFDLVTIGTWDGNERNQSGPDIFKVDEIVAVPNYQYATTFSTLENSRQAYPGSYPSGSFGYETGAIEKFTLRTTQVVGEAAVYRLQLLISHEAPNINLNLTASLKDYIPNLQNESWAIDNFYVNIRALIDSSGGTKYLWSTGESVQIIDVSKGGTYTVFASNHLGCRDTSTIELGTFPHPEFKITGKKEICENERIILKTDKKFSTYYWSTGETTDSIEIFLGGNYSVTVTDSNGCSANDSVFIINKYVRKFNMTGDSDICRNIPKKLGVDITFPSYYWSTGESTKEINITQPGEYSVTVTDTNGCTKTATRLISESFLEIAGISGIDFGEVCTGATAVKEIIIQNVGNVKFRFTDFRLLNGSKFAIGPMGDFPIRVDTNHNYYINILFSPDKEISYRDTIVMEVDSSCVKTYFIPLAGKGKFIPVSMQPDTLDYKYICPDESLIKHISIKNNGDFSLRISEIRFRIRDNFTVINDFTLPTTLTPGEERKIGILFKPDRLSGYSDSLLISLDEPCSRTYSIPVRGTGIYKTRIWLSDTSAIIGDSGYNFPVYAKRICGESTPDTLDFRAVLSFGATAFYPGFDSLMTKNEVIGNERIVTLEGQQILSDFSPVTFCFVKGDILTPAQELNPVKILDFTVKNSFKLYETQEGSISITGKCRTTLTQIKLKDDDEFLISPIPASESLSFQFVLYQPTEVKITINDIIGRQIAALAQGYQSAGNYNLTLQLNKIKTNNINEYADNSVSIDEGTYLILFETSYSRVIKKIQVIR